MISRFRIIMVRPDITGQYKTLEVKMLNKESYLTEEARKALAKKFKTEFIAQHLGISENRVLNMLRGKVRVLAIEKELLEELVSDQVPA